MRAQLTRKSSIVHQELRLSCWYPSSQVCIPPETGVSPPPTHTVLLFFLSCRECTHVGSCRGQGQPGHLLLLLRVRAGTGYKCSGGEASTKRDLPGDTAACCVWKAGLALAGCRSRGPFCSPGYLSSVGQVASSGPRPSVCPGLSPVLPAGLLWPPRIHPS